jgi:hypothetical protein
MRQVFDMVPPAGSGYALVLGAMLALTAALLTLFAWIAWSAQHVRFEVTADSLSIRGGLYGRTIPRSDLVLDQSQVLDLNADADRCPAWRTNGIGLPGYGAGWFKLRDGTRALAFVTERRQVVYVPTRANYALLLSVAQPEAFLAALRH